MRICCRCDRTIRATDYETIPVHSASAVRPDQYAHRQGDPQCRPIRARAL
jgi:hypothetical protein